MVSAFQEFTIKSNIQEDTLLRTPGKTHYLSSGNKLTGYLISTKGKLKNKDQTQVFQILSPHHSH